MIYTFYSYKGGVGRSMAVANVGEWLYLHSLRVVLVDWDLEAPGLEAYFPSDPADQGLDEQPGLMDLLLDYKEDLPYLRLPPEDEPRDRVVAALMAQLPSLSSRLQPLRSPESTTAGNRALWILTAGRRAGEAFASYAREVQRFDWADFYSRYRGDAFFEWLRLSLLAEDLADVVLIDTRTGISEMGGVATRQLADVVVSLCVPNNQNIEGTARLTQSFVRDEVVEARGRPLQLVVVPTRIENSEIDARNWARREFGAALDKLRPAAMRQEKQSFWDLRIPYVPKYAYKETLAVGAGDSAEELEEAYEKLARQLLALAPEGSRARERVEQGTQPTPPVAVPLVSNVPPRLPLVVGRQALVSDMRARLAQTSAPLVLYGIAGVGKTTLAIEYAHRFQPDYEVCWWIDASSPESVARGYTALAAGLDLKAPGSDALDAARRWLAAQSGWLLVLDGADEPAQLMDHVPTEQRGSVLITSRNPEWGRLARTLEVPVLERSASVEFLHRRTGDLDKDAADGLADELGDLPLAIEQACAYMEATGRSIELYRKAFAEEGTALLSRGLQQSAAGTPVAELWEADYRQLLRDRQARDLLALCSMLAPQVPVDLVARAPAFTRALTLDESIAGLRRFSFVTSQGGYLTVHPLLQSFVLGWLHEEDERMAASSAVDAVQMALQPPGETESSRLSAERLLPHALAAIAHAMRLKVAPARVVELMAAVARHQSARGDAQAASTTMREAVTWAENELPPKDPKRDELMADAASLQFELGNLQEALATLGWRLERAEKSGSKPGVVRVLGAQSLVLQAMGDTPQSKETIRQAIDRGSEHAPHERPGLHVIRAVIEERLGAHSDAANSALAALQADAQRAARSARDTLLDLAGRALTPREVDAYVRGLRLRIAHTSEAKAVCFSPDGHSLVSAGRDHHVRVWDTAGLGMMAAFERHAGGVNAVAFAPNAPRLASAFDDGKVWVLDANSLTPITPLESHAGRVNAVAFSPDGLVLASAGEDGKVRVVDASSGGLVTLLDVADAPGIRTARGVNALAFSPDGLTLAVAVDDGSTFVGEIPGAVLRPALALHSAAVKDVAISRDGRFIATASDDCTVHLRDTTSPSGLTMTLEGHSGAVNAVAFHPDGRVLASASDDGTVRLWDTATGRPGVQEAHASEANDVVFSPDGRTLAAAFQGGIVAVWDLTVASLSVMMPIPIRSEADVSIRYAE